MKVMIMSVFLLLVACVVERKPVQVIPAPQPDTTSEARCGGAYDGEMWLEGVDSPLEMWAYGAFKGQPMQVLDSVIQYSPSFADRGLARMELYNRNLGGR